MVEIVEVLGDGKVMGLEIIIDGKVHFIGDQDRWPGIRIGKFPSPRWQDEPWKRETVYGGKDLTYEELIAAADHAMERREEFIRNEGRDKILDSEDYKRLIDLRGILRNTLGWEYEDPDKLRAYFATQREKIIDRDTRWKVKNARDVLNSLLEHLE